MTHFQYRTPVTLIRRTVVTTNGDGNDVVAAVATPVLAQTVYDGPPPTEIVSGRDTVFTGKTIHFDAGTNLTALDAIEIGGQSYEIVGGPEGGVNPFSGWNPGVWVKVQKVTG